MKTVTKYICEASGQEFATEQEAIASEKLEKQFAAHRRRPLTVRQLRLLLGEMTTGAVLRDCFDNYNVTCPVGVSNGKFLVHFGGDMVTSKILYTTLGAAPPDLPVYAAQRGNLRPVVGATESTRLGLIFIDTAYEEKQ